MTLATHMEGDSKNIYVGAAFDESKREQYLKEAKGRANLASIFENFVIGVQSIVSGGTNFDEGHLSKSQAQIPLNEIPKAREVTNQWGHDIKLRVFKGVISGIVGLLIGLLISS